MDEPTAGIQPDIIARIGRVIGHQKALGAMAIVLVEQDADFARGLADGLSVFERGKLLLADGNARLSSAQVCGDVAP